MTQPKDSERTKIEDILHNLIDFVHDNILADHDFDMGDLIKEAADGIDAAKQSTIAQSQAKALQSSEPVAYDKLLDLMQLAYDTLDGKRDSRLPIGETKSILSRALLTSERKSGGNETFEEYKVTLSNTPLYQQAYDLIQQIESLGASQELTAVVTSAGKLSDEIVKRELTFHRVCKAFNELNAPTRFGEPTPPNAVPLKKYNKLLDALKEVIGANPTIAFDKPDAFKYVSSIEKARQAIAEAEGKEG